MTGAAAGTILDLSGRTILVSGAAGDIGSAICRTAAARGAHLLLVDLPSQKLRELALELSAAVCEVDLRNATHLKKQLSRLMADEVPNAAVAVAGVNSRHPFTDLDLEDWDRVHDITLRGCFLVVQQVSAAMLASNQAGSIVTVSSIGAWQPHRGLSHYEAAKAGVVALTRAAALELGGAGIRVNSVAPGVVDTAMTADTLRDSAYRDRRLARVPIGRFGTPQDVAEPVCFLLSDAAAWMTGSVVVVDGGQSVA